MDPESDAAVVLASYYAPHCNLNQFESSKFLGKKHLPRGRKEEVLEIVSCDSALSTKA